MTTLIIDAPEVVQRALGEACEARGVACRLEPDRRTDGQSAPALTADSSEASPAEPPTHPRTAIWFETVQPTMRRSPAAVVEALAGAAMARVILVTPLRGSGHPVSAATQALRSSADRFAGGIAVVAAGPPYGPGDELVSRLLVMMRSLPVVPFLARGERRYQPIWHQDLAALLLGLLDQHDGASPVTYRVAGPDVVTQRTLYDAMAPLLDRRPARVPVPELLTKLGVSMIDAASGTTADDERAWAIEADDQPLAGRENDLEGLLGRAPTRLRTALQALVVSLPEQLPETGVGSAEVKRFWSVIRGTALTPPGLLALFRDRFADVMPVPVGVEPGAPATHLTEGAVVTLHLPGRGHVQVRVEAADETHVVLATLRGHPLAGLVGFHTTASADGVRFEVMTADKAATPVDWLALTLGGARIQDANWRTVVTRVADVAGGTVDALHWDRRAASDAEVRHLSSWVARLAEALPS